MRSWVPEIIAELGNGFAALHFLLVARKSLDGRRYDREFAKASQSQTITVPRNRRPVNEGASYFCRQPSARSIYKAICRHFYRRVLRAHRCSIRAIASKPHDDSGRRPRGAIARLMHEHALTRAEIARLDVRDYRRAPARIAVRRHGRGPQTWLTLSTKSAAALDAWMVAKKVKHGALFINFDGLHRKKSGARLTGSGIYVIMRKRGSEAGCSGPLRPHGLRQLGVRTAARIVFKKNLLLESLLSFSRYSNAQTLSRALILAINRTSR